MLIHNKGSKEGNVRIDGHFHYITIFDNGPEIKKDMRIYSEQLKHPYWEIKRDEILFRDRNECQLCFNNDFLHVHHKQYLKNHLAWEYPNHYLITLCNKCHELFETDKAENGRKISINPERAKHSKLYKRIYETDFNERERKIINYIVINTRHDKQTIKLDAERIKVNNRVYIKSLENLIKSQLIFETDKPNIYRYNTIYFGP